MKIKKKAKALAASKVLTATKGTAPFLYAKISGSKKILINRRNGVVTVKKKTKKRTYKIKVKVMSVGNAEYKSSSWKIVTFKIKVK